MPRTRECHSPPAADTHRILTRAILNANNGLFIGSDDSPTVQPNPLSHFNTGHLEYFKFVGRVVGKALADGQLLDVHFTRSFYKHMLGIPITYHVRRRCFACVSQRTPSHLPCVQRRFV